MDGTLVGIILDGRTFEILVMSTGKKGKWEFRKTVGQKIETKIEKCTVFTSENVPVVVGSPDGITYNITFETKMSIK